MWQYPFWGWWKRSREAEQRPRLFLCRVCVCVYGYLHRTQSISYLRDTYRSQDSGVWAGSERYSQRRGREVRRWGGRSERRPLNDVSITRKGKKVCANCEAGDKYKSSITTCKLKLWRHVSLCWWMNVVWTHRESTKAAPVNIKHYTVSSERHKQWSSLSLSPCQLFCSHVEQVVDGGVL